MRWSAADVGGTAAAVAPWWALLTADLPPDVVADLLPPQVAPFLPGGAPTAAAIDVEGMEAALAALSRAGRTLAVRGIAMAPHTGTVDGVFLGTGGVPKNPVARAEVTPGGLLGDRQRTRKHHGRVWQALCLWSAEVITDLQGEGHPVFGGACGENVLVRGVDWASVRPGARLRLGTALVEVSLPTAPCKQIRPFFGNAAIQRVDHARFPGSSRWYAAVVEPGHVAVGDAVAVEPVRG